MAPSQPCHDGAPARPSGDVRPAPARTCPTRYAVCGAAPATTVPLGRVDHEHHAEPHVERRQHVVVVGPMRLHEGEHRCSGHDPGDLGAEAWGRARGTFSNSRPPVMARQHGAAGAQVGTAAHRSARFEQLVGQRSSDELGRSVVAVGSSTDCRTSDSRWRAARRRQPDQRIASRTREGRSPTLPRRPRRRTGKVERVIGHRAGMLGRLAASRRIPPVGTPRRPLDERGRALVDGPPPRSRGRTTARPRCTPRRRAHRDEVDPTVPSGRSLGRSRASCRPRRSRPRGAARTDAEQAANHRRRDRFGSRRLRASRRSGPPLGRGLDVDPGPRYASLIGIGYPVAAASGPRARTSRREPAPRSGTRRRSSATERLLRATGGFHHAVEGR